MKKTFNLYSIVIVAALVVFFFFALPVLVDEHEVQECLTWKQYQEDYPSFYLVGWQIDQCQHHGISFEE
jgi:uncharacterized membrane protein